MRYYHTTYNNHSSRRINFRRLLLLGALVADFFAFYSIIDIVIVGAVYLIQMFALFALSLGLRLYATTLLVTFDYRFIGDKLVITRANTFKGHTVLGLKKGDEIEFICDEYVLPNAITDYSTGAKDAKLLKINGKFYMLALDEYMTAMVNTFVKDTSEND